jgi:hypothetical protein
MIYKWFISGSMDTGKRIPRFVFRHVNRCTSCKQFADSTAALNERLLRDADEILGHTPSHLGETVLSGLNRPPVPVRNNSFKPRRLVFRPVLTGVLALLLIVVGVWWFTAPGEPPASGKQVSVTQVPDNIGITLPETPLQDLAAVVESPLQNELRSLKEAMHSTVRMFSSYFDMDI